MVWVTIKRTRGESFEHLVLDSVQPTGALSIVMKIFLCVREILFSLLMQFDSNLSDPVKS